MNKREQIEVSIVKRIRDLPESIKENIVTALKDKVTHKMVPIWVNPDSDDVLEWNGAYAESYLNKTG